MARILSIDDEPAALRLRAKILEGAGYSVATATTIDEALKKFQSDQFDLVVSDHVLGRGTGTQLASELRRLKPDVPILILSGTGEIPVSCRINSSSLGCRTKTSSTGPTVVARRLYGVWPRVAVWTQVSVDRSEN